MKILEYNDLDLANLKKQYKKVVGFLKQDDFHSAEVKKMAELDYYRAKLDDASRLLFKIVHYQGERYALILEVIIPLHRKKRTYFNALLARNELNSNNPYNRQLVKRIRTGYYLLNPRLEIRRGEDWINVYQAANLSLIEKAGGGNNKLLQWFGQF